MPDDEHLNNILATGGVFGALHKAGVDAHVVMVDDLATNQLLITFPFLKSIYRVTVERMPDDDED